MQQPHPPFWMGAGSPEVDPARRAGGLQPAARPDRADRPDHRARRDLQGRVAAAAAGPTDPDRSASPARCRSSAARRSAQSAYALRTKVLKAIGGLARGPGAERYQNIGSHADPNLASEESALLGTPEEIIARLKKLEAGGVDYVLLVDPTGSTDALRTFAEEIMPAFRGIAAHGVTARLCAPAPCCPPSLAHNAWEIGHERRSLPQASPCKPRAAPRNADAGLRLRSRCSRKER